MIKIVLKSQLFNHKLLTCPNRHNFFFVIALILNPISPIDNAYSTLYIYHKAHIMKNYLLDNYNISIINEHAIRNFFLLVYKKYGLELTADNHLKNYTTSSGNIKFTNEQSETLNNILKDCNAYCRIYDINLNKLAADVLGRAYLSKPVFADLLMQQYLSQF